MKYLVEKISKAIEKIYSNPKIVIDDELGVFKILDHLPRIKGENDWNTTVEPPNNYFQIEEGQEWYFCEKISSESKYCSKYWALPLDSKNHQYLYKKDKYTLESVLSDIKYALLVDSSIQWKSDKINH